MAFDHKKEKASINAVYDKTVKVTEKALVMEYKKSLDSIRLTLAKTYEKYSVAGQLTLAEMSQYNRLTNLNKAVTTELGKLGIKTGSKIKTLTGDVYHESFFREGYIVNNLAGININYGILSPEKIIAATENPLQYIGLKRNRGQVILNVRAEITSSLIQGENYTKMARRVKKALEKNANNAMRIARTEAHRSQIKGELDSIDYAEEQGIILIIIWLAALDWRTRDDHGTMDGQKADEDGNFHFPSGGITRGPGQSGIAEQDIHCRCDVIEEVDEIRPQKRRLGKEGIGEYKNYDEWAKDQDIKSKVAIPKLPVTQITPYLSKERMNKLVSNEDISALSGKEFTLKERYGLDANQKATYEAMKDWTTKEYSWMRDWEQMQYKGITPTKQFLEGHDTVKVQRIRSYIEKAPKYKGSIARGINLDKIEYKTGETMKLKAMASFSEGTIPAYSEKNTWLVIGNNKKGVSTKLFSNYLDEREVLAPKGDYKITGIKKLTYESKQKTVFYLDEV